MRPRLPRRPRRPTRPSAHRLRRHAAGLVSRTPLSALPSAGWRREFHAVADRHRLLNSVNRRAAVDRRLRRLRPRGRGPRDEGRDRAGVDAVGRMRRCGCGIRAARRFVPRPALVIGRAAGKMSTPTGRCARRSPRWRPRRPICDWPRRRGRPRVLRRLADPRPPGTWNHKHRPPQRVRVVDHRLAVRFELDEVVGALPHVDARGDRSTLAEAPSVAARRDQLLSDCRRRCTSVGCSACAPRPGRKVRCPFHEDVRPSLHVYRTGERGWCCFSCRRGGTIYDLAAAVWGTKTRGRDFLRASRAA